MSAGERSARRRKLLDQRCLCTCCRSKATNFAHEPKPVFSPAGLSSAGCTARSGGTRWEGVDVKGEDELGTALAMAGKDVEGMTVKEMKEASFASRTRLHSSVLALYAKANRSVDSARVTQELAALGASAEGCCERAEIEEKLLKVRKAKGGHAAAGGAAAPAAAAPPGMEHFMASMTASFNTMGDSFGHMVCAKLPRREPMCCDA